MRMNEGGRAEYFQKMGFEVCVCVFVFFNTQDQGMSYIIIKSDSDREQELLVWW